MFNALNPKQISPDFHQIKFWHDFKHERISKRQKTKEGILIYLRDDFPKKVAFLLDFVQIRGGGPSQIFCPLFTNCIYWVNLGMGRERETPAQIVWHICIKKKWYKLSKMGGWREGGLR